MMKMTDDQWKSDPAMARPSKMENTGRATPPTIAPIVPTTIKILSTVSAYRKRVR